jgi:hypothetical protein
MTEPNAEPVAPDLSVDGLLATFGAPATFDIKLPNGGVLVCRGFGSYAEKRQFEKDRDLFVQKRVAEANGARKSQDPILAGPYADYLELMIEDNLAAAFTIHRTCVSPVFEPIEALRLTAAPAFAAYFMDQLSWNASNFLLSIKNELYGAAKKD